jgi:hypothetical protein
VASTSEEVRQKHRRMRRRTEVYHGRNQLSRPGKRAFAWLVAAGEVVGTSFANNGR